MIEVVIDKPGLPPVTYRLQGGAFFIGRHPENDIVLDDHEVSRKHARLLVDGDLVVVEDLRSGNGTFVDGQAVSSAPLPLGASFEIVPFRLEVRAAEEPEPARAPATPWLEGIAGSVAGQRFSLDGEALSIGRADDQHITIKDPGASRSHAMVMLRPTGWCIRDNGSANGLFVNEQRLREAVLTPGDVIRIGTTELRFHGADTGDDEGEDDGIELEEATVEASAQALFGGAPPRPPQVTSAPVVRRRATPAPAPSAPAAAPAGPDLAIVLGGVLTAAALLLTVGLLALRLMGHL